LHDIAQFEAFRDAEKPFPKRDYVEESESSKIMIPQRLLVRPTVTRHVKS